MSEIQSVSVLSVDEERLKYRVIVTAGEQAGYNSTGEFFFNLPPPTNFANNNNYNQCLIKLDSFVATPNSADANPQWNYLNGVGIKVGAVVIELDTPSSQTIRNSLIEAPGARAEKYLEEKGFNMIGGFKQLLPLQVVNVGIPGAAGGAAPAPGGYSWVGIGSGISSTDPILCGNIFGRDTTLRIIDPARNKPVWIQQGDVANHPNIGTYCFAFTVTMIPNDRSEGNS
jgi:hypothetical protein